MTTDLVEHAFHGQCVRVIRDEHTGQPWFVAADVAKILGYRMASDMTRRLDDDDRGTRSVRTPSGDQSMTVVTEPGLYSAILGSQIPGARDFKRWVTHEVLPTIHRTGSYGVPSLDLERMDDVALILQAGAAALARVQELEAPAAAFQALADSSGDYALRDAAQILDRDPAIRTGQNRLGAYLRQIGWVDRKSVPYQSRVDQGLICSRARHYDHPRTGERVLAAPQLRITAKGLGKLHALLGGAAPLEIADRPILMAVSS